MTIEEIKTLLRRFVDDQNRGDLTVFNRFCTPEFVAHLNMMDAMTSEQTRQFMGTLQTAFPDGIFRIEDTVAEGDKIAVRYTWQGTHKGPFQGIDPTGKKVNLVFLAIDRFSNGKLAEAWLMMDFADLMAQLGAVPGNMTKK